MKFQRKPEFIEAIQWDGTEESIYAIAEMAKAEVQSSSTSPDVLYISYDNCLMRVELNEWVIKGKTSTITGSTLKDLYDVVNE